MQKWRAKKIYSAHTGFLENALLVLDDKGTVLDLIADYSGDTTDSKLVDGLLCPGFVNAHCHLELSHLHGKIAKNTGFAGFAGELMHKRNEFEHEEILEAIVKAENLMLQNGIVAVGDISNSVDSFEQKLQSNLRYHTFIELISLNPRMAEKAGEVGLFLKAECPQSSSLAPHAPYSVSNELLELIGNSARSENLPLTMHNQESKAETEFFTRGTGPVRDLYDSLGLDISWYKPTGVNSLRSRLKQLPFDRNLILVHNTYTSADDIVWAEYYSKKIYWCFCPNANLYIENTLPDYQLFLDAKVKMVVGTDSLASNDTLSILDELKIISKAAPELPLGEMLTWATRNGADALQLEEFGTFEKGKNPGLIQISGLEEDVNGNLRMSAAAEIARMA
jgi:aminodeoxyfutalosine deaminase